MDETCNPGAYVGVIKKTIVKCQGHIHMRSQQLPSHQQAPHSRHTLTLTLCSRLLVLAEFTMPRVQTLLPSFSTTFSVFQYLQKSFVSWRVFKSSCRNNAGAGQHVRTERPQACICSCQGEMYDSLMFMSGHQQSWQPPALCKMPAACFRVMPCEASSACSRHTDPEGMQEVELLGRAGAALQAGHQRIAHVLIAH